MTFLALAHMLDARKMLGWGRRDDNLPCTCAHRQSEFVKTIRRCRGNLQVHTGTIDGVWRLLKDAIPDQLVAKKCKKKN